MPSSPSGARRAAAVLTLALVAGVPATPSPTGPAAVTARLSSAGSPFPQPEGVVRGASAAGAIPGRYLVVLNSGQDVGSAAGLVGGRVAHTYAGLSAFSARLTALEARRLAANPAVRLVEQDRVVRLAATYRRPGWNLDRLDQRSRKPSATFTPTDDGSSVHAYVIDTGIRITHADLRGRASYGYDFIGGDAVANDCNGHGTHVAGILGGTRYGVAKKVRLVAVRVLDCAGNGDLESVVSGVNWVTQHAIKPAV